MIKENYNYFVARGLPEKKIKYKNTGNHLTFEKKIKLYDYYTCDCCKKDIPIKEKWERSVGGVIELPSIITKIKPITLALCNKCFSKVIKEFDE